MNRPKKILFTVLVIVIILPLVTFCGLYCWLVRSGLPKLDGNLTVAGLSAPATVHRDVHGIPHIYAANPHDLFLSQGFVHAQDRLWQMESTRRAAHGRLSEVIGERGLRNDRFMRVLGIAQAAQADWETIDADTQGLLQAYSDGVNAFINQAGNKLPLEFKILRIQPAQWAPIDTLVFGKLLAWSLSSNYEHELVISQLAKQTTYENLLSILPDYSGPHLIPDANYSSSLRTTATLLLAEAEAIRSIVPLAKPDQGSNAWVVNGTHTASGRPMLANDPHQTLSMPSLWYEVGLHTTDGVYDVVGSSLPCVPGIEIGHNNRIAWGVTNARPDVQDVFIEALNDDGTQYQYMGKWKDLITRTETINVKDGDPIVIAVRTTHHGPLISDVLKNTKQHLSLCWTGLDGHRLVQAILQLNRAQNWEEFRAAVKHWEVPAMHFIYADVDGHIGYQLPGAIPIRANNDVFSLLPVSGSDGMHEWVGFIPYEDLPHDLDPAGGFFASANNKPVDNTYPYFISHYWQPPFRVERISEAIRTAKGLTPSDFGRLHADVHSKLNRKLAQALSADVQTSDPVEITALKLLKDWSGDMHADSPAAVISEVAIFNLIRETLNSTFDENSINTYIKLPAYPYLFVQILLDQPDNPWWDGHRRTVLHSVLTATVNELKSKLDGDPADWTWGQLHTMTFAHPLGSIGLLRPIFNRGPFPMGGNWNTINSGAHLPDKPYAMALGPAYRIINDVGDWDNTRSIITSGQSGQPFSRHYADNIDDWQAVRYHLLPFSQSVVKEKAVHTLKLNPVIP